MRKDSSSRRITDASDQRLSRSTNTQSQGSASITAWVDEMTKRTQRLGDDQSNTDVDPSTALSDPFTSTAPKVPEDALQFDLTTQRIGESDRYLQFRFFWNGLDGNCDEHTQVQRDCPHLEALKRNPPPPGRILRLTGTWVRGEVMFFLSLFAIPLLMGKRAIMRRYSGTMKQRACTRISRQRRRTCVELEEVQDRIWSEFDRCGL